MKKIKIKIRFYKLLLIEIIETLITICIYMCERDHKGAFRLHIDTLKRFSNELRGIDNEFNRQREID